MANAKSKWRRLRWVTSMYKEDRIVENFRTISDIFPYNRIQRDGKVFEFDRQLHELPNEFTYRGEKTDIHDLLKDTWTTGFLVIKDDTIRFEEYYLGNAEDTLNITWSAGKSVVSALVGIAIEEGLIDGVDCIVSDLAPELKGSGYEGIRLKDVLQMSSGIGFNEDYRSFFSDINRMGRTIALGRSLNDFACSLKAERKPGTFCHYVSMDTQVLGMVLQAVTGRSLSEYLEEKIWKKLGMESDARWLVDDTGMELAFGTLNAVLRDYARFGRLYLLGGNWDGQQIVPKSWVEDSMRMDGPHLLPGKHDHCDFAPGYGYQWWIPEKPQGDFYACGIQGQYIYVHPSKNVVIVKTSADPNWTANSENNPKVMEMMQYLANHLDE